MMRLLILPVILLSFVAPVAAQFNFPDAPTVDQIITGPGGQQMKWDGTKWVAMLGGGGGGAATVTVGPTAPASPTNGALWFNTTNVQMYIWYSTGTGSSQWAPVAHP